MSLSPAAPLHNRNEKRLVCGIDFGTSGSGFGYTWKKKLCINEKWGDISASKAPTQLLYDGDKVIGWGFNAERKYTQLVKDLSAHGRSTKHLTLLKYFKMHIFDNNGNFTPLNAARSFNIVEVVADYLREMWGFIRGALHSKFGDVPADDIKWSLTIPAIWSEVNKDLMKKAAVKAGIISDVNVSDEDFMLVLEPEAAAIQCLQNCDDEGYPLEDGTTYLVIDAGAGTIDLTAHEVRGGKLYEKIRGGGGKHGSSEINVAFMEFIKGVLGVDVVKKFAADSPEDFNDLERSIENLKCSVTDFSEARDLDIPEELNKLISPKPKELTICAHKPMLHIDSKNLEKIFMPTLIGVEGLVRELMQKKTDKPFDYIFIVGGFAESPLLIKMIQDKFGNPQNVDPLVMHPTHPIQAVVTGAVMLGIDPSKIRERRMRKTYGVATVTPFIANVHDIKKRVTIAGRQGFWCEDFFDKFATIDEAVGVDEYKERVYKPQTPDQTAMELVLYSTPKKDPVYIEPSKMVLVGYISVEMPNTTAGLARSVAVRFSFGLSAIQVKAIENGSAVEKIISINYEGIPPKIDIPSRTAGSYHIIFLNDTSGSMSIGSIVPSLTWIPHKNVLGALYESCYALLKQREGCGDMVTFVGYDSSASIEFSYAPLESNAQELVTKMSARYAAGGTCFRKPIELLDHILEKTPTGTTHTPLAFFMTDGECADGGAADILGRVVNKYTNFSLHTVWITDDKKNGHPVLQKLAEVGKGQFFVSNINLNDMKQTYTRFVALME